MAPLRSPGLDAPSPRLGTTEGADGLQGRPQADLRQESLLMPATIMTRIVQLSAAFLLGLLFGLFYAAARI